MQESQPLAECLLLMLALDSQPQFCVQPAKATFEPSDDLVGIEQA